MKISAKELEKTLRKSCTREFKLKVVDRLKANGQHVSTAARHFSALNKRVHEGKTTEATLREQYFVSTSSMACFQVRKPRK